MVCCVDWRARRLHAGGRPEAVGDVEETGSSVSAATSTIFRFAVLGDRRSHAAPPAMRPPHFCHAQAGEQKMLEVAAEGAVSSIVTIFTPGSGM